MEKLPASEPILLQHYPLYRKSDAECTGEDSAPPEEKNIPFKEKYDVLSQEASQKLLWWFHPRLILSGHTHSACEVLHAGKIPEISVPSFSWRNRNNPSFIMGSITPTDFSLQKCFLPFESRVFTIYCAAGALLVILVLAHVQLLTPPFYFAQRLISKHKAVWRARHLHSVTEIPKLRTVKHQTIFMPANDLIWLLVWRQVAFTHTIEVLYSWYDYYRINN